MGGMVVALHSHARESRRRGMASQSSSHAERYRDPRTNRAYAEYIQVCPLSYANAGHAGERHREARVNHARSAEQLLRQEEARRPQHMVAMTSSIG